MRPMPGSTRLFRCRFTSQRRGLTFWSRITYSFKLTADLDKVGAVVVLTRGRAFLVLSVLPSSLEQDEKRPARREGKGRGGGQALVS